MELRFWERRKIGRRLSPLMVNNRVPGQNLQAQPSTDESTTGNKESQTQLLEPEKTIWLGRFREKERRAGGGRFGDDEGIVEESRERRRPTGVAVNRWAITKLSEKVQHK
ncbi:exostosin family protein [Striga asiatica]|uniref:Exostosin family protein n=1 Tax=Striga asiatica TaxID=4170 RepID=A0A5A7QWQ9_STRAF|nr:exostosin family protein [Striga asiatica]